MSKAWFIFEVETGLIDGWYFNEKGDMDGLKQHWDEKRPKFNHVIAETTLHKGCYIPDHMCMNRA